MSNPSTQDTQKVFKSVLEKFNSFNGAVESVSSTKHMTEIYSNMTKLFEDFTRGALTGQGANSEIVLRTIYRSLSENFLKIVQNTDAVDKISEVIKKKQQSYTPETVVSAPVSETTKKVVTKTLDPNNCDIMSVVVDFVDELQTAILQVKLNLTRDYERMKILRAKSAEGQQEDLDTLNREFQTQSDATVETLQTMQDWDEEWTDAQTKNIGNLVETFNQAGVMDVKGVNLGLDADMLGGDRDMKAFLKKPNFDVKHIIDTIHRASVQLDKVSEQAAKQIQEQAANMPHPMPQPAVGSQANGGPAVRKESSEIGKMQERQTGQLLKDSSKVAGSVEKQQKEKGMKNLLSGKLEEQQAADTKLQTKPQLANGMHPQMPEQQGSKMQVGPQLAKKKETEEKKIDKEGVLSTLGIIHGNIQKFIKSGKILRAFSMNYTGIHKQVNKQFKKSNKDEQTISDDLDETKKGVAKLKKKNSGNWLTKFIFGGFGAGLLFIAAGAIILITLARAAWRSWKNKYMPETDEKTFTILGVPIPGVSTLKAIGIGIWNFIVVGLPQRYNKVKGFFKKLYEDLFGKKGCMRNTDMMYLTLKRIFWALITNLYKKPAGILVNILGTALSVIPFVGPIFMFLSKFGPLLYTFIANRIHEMWAHRAEAKIAEKESLEARQKRESAKAIRMLKKKLAVAAKGVKPFIPPHEIPGLMTPHWSPGGVEANRPPRAAIMRRAQQLRFRDEKQYASSSGNMLSTASQVVKRYRTEDLYSSAESASYRDYSRDPTNLLEAYYRLSREMSILHRRAKNGIYNKGGADWAKSSEVSAFRSGVDQVATKFLDPFITAYTQQLEQYIKQLRTRHESRFGNIDEIYDIETNSWNPRLIMTESDLLSALPADPFSPLHTRADILMGYPSDAKKPFGWNFMDGAKKLTYVEADPYLFQIVRAQERIDWLNKFRNHMHYNLGAEGTNLEFGWKSFAGEAGADSTKRVKEEDSGSMFDFGSGITQHGSAWDQFGLVNAARKRWMERYQFPNSFGYIWSRKKGEYMYDGQFDEQVARLSLGQDQKSISFKEFYKKRNEAEPFFGRLIGRTNARTKILNKQYAVEMKVSSDQQGAHDYDEEMKRHEKEEGGAEGWRKRFDENVNKKFWNFKPFGKASYGNARMLMLVDGVAHLFDRGGIAGPISWAAHIMEKMGMNGFWAGISSSQPSSKELDKVGDLAFLIHRFIDQKYKAGPTFNWETHIVNDQVMMNTFATSLLEYFAYIVLPQWNLVEKTMVGFTNGQVDEKAVNDSITKLLQLMSGQAILDFMFTHIRFMNAHMKVIEYGMDGITDAQVKELDKWRQKRGIPLLSEKKGILSGWESMFGKFGSMSASELKDVLSKLEKQISIAAYEAKYTGDHEYEKDLRKYYQSAYDAYKSIAGLTEASRLPKLGIENTNPMSGKSPAEQRAEEDKKDEEMRKKREERRKKQEEETKKRAAEEAERKRKVVEAEKIIKEQEAIRKHEQAYENMLERLVKAPDQVGENELSSFGEEVKNLKQEAENRINNLPRQEREMKLALIRGDTLSDKTFKEMKDTAIGLHGSLQGYIEEVGKIPVGSVLAISSPPSGGQTPVQQIDTDKVDMGDE